MTPEDVGFAMERLFDAGARDVWTTPIGMKKSRPGVLLRALCLPEKRQAVLDVFLRDTTTLGVREHRCSRTALQRSVSETDSPWGPVRCKQAGGYGVSRKKYEFDDLARIAREPAGAAREAAVARSEACSSSCTGDFCSGRSHL